MRPRHASRSMEYSQRDWPKNAQFCEAVFGIGVILPLLLPNATARMHSCLPRRLKLRHSPSSRSHCETHCLRRASSLEPAGEYEVRVGAGSTLAIRFWGSGNGVALIASTSDWAGGTGGS